jgi:hypothetical protein
VVLQAVAARLARVDLVYHAFDAAGVEEVEAGLRILNEAEAELCAGDAAAEVINLTKFICKVQARNFQWGQSDGN